MHVTYSARVLVEAIFRLLRMAYLKNYWVLYQIFIL